ncbi:Neuropathy target esterase sws, partial [Papilio machaon]
KPGGAGRGPAALEPRSSQHTFSTVAVVPVGDDVPLTAFTYELYHSLSAIGPTVRLTSDVIRKLLGLTIMDPNNEYRLSSWLAQQEDKHKVALYQCDPSLTQWTQRCIRQADCILIVALGDKQPSIGKVTRNFDFVYLLIYRKGDRASGNPYSEGAGVAAPGGRGSALGHRALAQHALLGLPAPPCALSSSHVHPQEPVQSC